MRRGEIYWCDFGEPRGFEQAKLRPALIVQATVLHAVWPTVIVIPVTSQPQYRHLPTCVDVPQGVGGLTAESVALCHQMVAVDKRRILSYMGELPEEKLWEIESTVMLTLGLAGEE